MDKVSQNHLGSPHGMLAGHLIPIMFIMSVELVSIYSLN